VNEKSLEAYNPLTIEPEIYAQWEREKAFRSVADSRQSYCIVIPPPNVTGALHMGHALNNSIQDVLVRYQRMRGLNALWLPGTDHAGVATQSVVERTLWEEEKKTRYDLGREKLLELIWQWKDRFGGRIIEQLKALGSSCDWDRTRFTMDPGLSRAVRFVFVSLFHEGLVYRGKRLINWCTHHRTALSNDELVYKDSPAHFWHVRYPIANDPARGIVVATTRPETMLGDTAVAVHPDDGRYADLIGKTVILPLLGRPIPVIADPLLADPERGTGAVKVTPAHDPNDYECARRNNLPFVNILSEDGTLNDNAGPYRGLTVMEARERVVEDLEKGGLLEKIEDHVHPLAHCYRCGSVIEPFLSDQWFVSMQPLVELARDTALGGQVRFFPESRLKQFLDWLDTTPDWCISRQIWWGHRIPVWYCTRCNPDIRVDAMGEPAGIPGDAAPVVPAPDEAWSDPGRCPACGHESLVQDPDVLDTWFSSQLWPISTLGWPDRTDDLDAYYPTNVLVTARDIIALWVARMIMMGRKFTGRTPFHHVYVHGTILDEKGDIMSKSRGNGVDPLKLIQGGTDVVGGRQETYKPYGADALRYGVLSMATAGQDIRLVIQRRKTGKGAFDVDIPKMEEGRRFCNKIWQVTRGVVLPQCADLEEPDRDAVEIEDRWLSHRLSSGIRIISGHLDRYEIGEACVDIYRLLWNDFCSWYVELAKPRLWDGDDPGRRPAQTLLVEAVTALLRMLHPMMPFISERLWRDVSALRKKAGLSDLGDRIIHAPWPDPDAFGSFPEEHGICDAASMAASAINNIKAENTAIKEARLPVVYLKGGDDVIRSIMGIRGLARFVNVERLAPHGDAAEGELEGCAVAVAGPVEVYVPLKGLVDFESEIHRLQKKIQQAEGKLGGIRRKLSNPDFLEKAKPEVVRKEREKEQQLADEIARLGESLEAIGKLAR
jgi:valyl-tRNA synthetase